MWISGECGVCGSLHESGVCGSVVRVVCVDQWREWCVWISGESGVCGLVVRVVCVDQW